MINMYVIVDETDEEDVLEQLHDQGVLVEDWDAIIIIPADQENVDDCFIQAGGQVKCTSWQIDRLAEDGCGESVWHSDVEVNNETCYVGVKYH